MEKEVVVWADQIRDAIAGWYDEGAKNVSPVLETIMAQMKEGVNVLVPVIFPEGFDPGVKEPGKEDEEIEITVRQLDAEDGKFWFACFTHPEEVEKGADTDTIQQSLVDIMRFTASADAEHCLGLVLNPWDNSLSIPMKIIASMLDAITPHPQDEIDLNHGAEAYMQGDYATAVEYYQKSAAAGNIIAMSNLGYCHYYGRSIPADKGKARECWEKAAVMGNVCAIYKLGDMYRNGDLPEDPVFSKLMYLRAYAIAAQNKDIYEYPDTCLRILKYCREDCSPEQVKNIAQSAVEGFRERVNRGDSFAEGLMKEAEAFLG